MTERVAFESLLRVAEAGTLALVSSLWHAALLLAAVIVALRLLPRLSAAMRSLVWTAVLGLMLLAPFWPQVAAGASSAHAVRVAPGVSLAIAGLWAAASLFRLSQLLTGMVGLRRVWARATPVARAARLQVRTTFRVSRTAELCTSADVSRPGVLGFFAPRVLIPKNLYEQLSEQELAQVLLHEGEHLRRWDDWRNLLQKLALAIVPLNPFLAVVERRLCLERELACDESVVLATRAPKRYAACLLRLAEERGLRRPVALVLGAWERRPELARRVSGILASCERPPLRARRGALVAGALLAGTVAVTSVTAHAPALVSFTAAAAPSSKSASFAEALAAAPAAAFTPVSFQAPAAQQATSQPHMVKTLMRLPVSPVPQTRPAYASRRAVYVARRNGHRAARVAAPLAADWVEQDRDMVSAPAPATIRFTRITFTVYDTAYGFQIISATAALPAAGGVVFLQL